ncbi:MAG: outer membrane protein assembly factor BamA [Chlamydiota bacterium]
MRKKNLLLLFALFTLIFFAGASQVHAQLYTSEAYEGKQVASIHAVVENLPKQETLNQSQFLSKLRTKVGDPFSQLIFDQDLKTLSEEYDRAEPILTIEGAKLKIEIKLWLKPVIRSIIWEGNKKIKTSKLQKELGIKPNTIFNRETFNKAFAKVKDYYVKKGFFESELEYEVIPYREANAIDIKVTVKEGQSSHISRICFTGLTEQEEREILKMMATKKYNFFTSWVTGAGTYHEEVLQYDQLVIVNYLQNKGFANASARIEVTETPGGRIGIHIHADKGQLFYFGTTSIEGNALLNKEDIEKSFGIQKGTLYSPENLQHGIQRIRNLYGKDGYIEVKIDHTLQLSSDQPVYNIVIRIEEGGRIHIGLIRILGNTSTNSNVILRESLLVPGEVFDLRRLQMTEARLMMTGYFKSVNVYAVKTAEDDQLAKNYRDVVIEVEETTTGSINLFFGFSTQENIIGGLELVEQNFDHRGLWKWWREGLSSLRGAGELAKIRAQIGAKQQNYTLTWVDPYFNDTPWRIGFETGYSNSRLQTDDYRVKAISGSIFANYPINDYWTVGASWRIRSSTIEFSDTSKVKPDERARQENNQGIVTGIIPQIAYDSTNSIIRPTRGFKSTLQGQYAFVFRRNKKNNAPKSFPFASVAYRNSYYYPVWSRGIFRVRWDFQFLFPLGSGEFQYLPINERYFLGGETTVRGYKAFRIGPKFDPLEGKSDDDRDPKGGISSTLLSFQYTQNLHRLIDIFCFFDAGALSSRTLKIPDFNASVGIGLNLTLLNGVPLTGGVALPINANANGTNKKEDFQYYFFSMAGQF